MKKLAYTLLLFLKWIPRILCILLAIFTGLFSLDAFGPGITFWKGLIGFIIHLIPTFLIIGILMLSWKWDWIGGISFIVLGVAYMTLMTSVDKALPLIYIPIFITGLLFLISWFLRKYIKDAQAAYRGDS